MASIFLSFWSASPDSAPPWLTLVRGRVAGMAAHAVGVFALG